jgi:hypothetical protein
MQQQFLTPAGIAALSACGLALLALLLVAMVWRTVRRLRVAQTVVLGEHGERDLVAHAERLEGGFRDLQEWVEEVMQGLGARMAVAEKRLDGAVAYAAVVRYDAYGELSGRQSSSIALLDSHRSGVVISSILHRDQARIYAKHVHEGQGEYELSPEEAEAIETALSGGGVSHAA